MISIAILRKTVVFGIFSVLTASYFSGFAFAEEISARLEDPFLLPQTTFYLGNGNYTVNLSDQGVANLNDNKLNVFGFDLEVNHSRFMNIGAYFRVESLGIVTGAGVNSLFSTLLGGFTRFYYVPPFLKGKTFRTNVFLRLELGAGPIIMGSPSGIVVQPGAHLGVETYINKWIGLSFSYGQVYEFGKETLAGSSTIWNQGRVILLGVKTTFF